MSTQKDCSRQEINIYLPSWAWAIMRRILAEYPCENPTNKAKMRTGKQRSRLMLLEGRCGAHVPMAVSEDEVVISMRIP